MNSDIQITKNKLAYFKALDGLGVKNFFTFSNDKWGHMGLRDTNFRNKFDAILETHGINSNDIIYLGAEQNDNVQILTSDNFKIYKLFNKHELSSADKNIIILNSDALLTKLAIPIVFTPADCAVIYIVGIDKKDGKKFLGFIHSGVFGTMLKIYLKIIEIAHTFYDFENADLNIFITPAVSGENYRKDKSEDIRGAIFRDPEWKDFVIDYGDKFGIKIIDKIISDYKKLGIKNIIDSGMDTFEEAKKGNLHSLTYYKSINAEPKNFMVMGMLQ